MMTRPEIEQQFENHYTHCSSSWQDTWSCACNDKCPECGAEIEPHYSKNLTTGEVVIDVVPEGELTMKLKLEEDGSEGEFTDYYGQVELAPDVLLDIRMSKSTQKGKAYLSLSVGSRKATGEEFVEIKLTDTQADEIIAASQQGDGHE